MWLQLKLSLPTIQLGQLEIRLQSSLDQSEGYAYRLSLNTALLHLSACSREQTSILTITSRTHLVSNISISFAYSRRALFLLAHHKACPQKRGPKKKSPSDDGHRISKHRKITVSQSIQVYHCKTNHTSGQESVKEGTCRPSKK